MVDHFLNLRKYTKLVHKNGCRCERMIEINTGWYNIKKEAEPHLSEDK